MANGNGFSKMPLGPISGGKQQSSIGHSSEGLHPAWSAFVRYCQELGHGEIECLKIQDGLPVLAEVTKKKVKFA
jgi:hypothetical protein